MSEEEIAESFREVFGFTLGHLVEEYANSTDDYYPATGPFACGAAEEEVAWEGGSAVCTAVLSCSDQRTIAEYPSEDSVRYWRRWRLQIAVGGLYMLGATRGSVSITKCLSAPADAADLTQSQMGVNDDWLSRVHPLARTFGLLWEEPVALEAGTYDLWVGQEREDADQEFTVSITKL